MKTQVVRASQSDMVAMVALQTGLSKSAVDEVIRTFLQLVSTQATAGNRVTIRGFGSFYLRQSGGFTRQGKYIRKCERVAFSPSATACANSPAW